MTRHVTKPLDQISINNGLINKTEQINLERSTNHLEYLKFFACQALTVSKQQLEFVLHVRLVPVIVTP